MECPPSHGKPGTNSDDGPSSEEEKEEEEEEAAEDEEQEKITCYGCDRIKGTSHCFINTQEVVQWQKGRWCDDCHNVWRTVFRPKFTLTLFKPWIKDNVYDFEVSLAAYLSFRAEGHEKITASMLGQRTKTLEYLSQLLGWQLRPVMIKPLGDIKSHVDPKDFCTILSEDGPQLGVMVPSTLASSKSSFHRPHLPGSVALLCDRALLATTRDSDAAFLKEKWKMDINVQGGCSISMVQAPAAGSISLLQKNATNLATQTRMDLAFEALSRSDMVLLKFFSSEAWTNVKTTIFKKPIAKITTFRATASHEGNATNISKADTWISGLMSGKNFLAKHRDYERSRNKHASFLKLVDDLKCFSDFLIANSVTLAKSFSLLRLRAIFWLNFETDGKINSLEKLFRLLLDEGLASAAAAEESVVDVDSWLRSIVLEAMTQQLKKGKADTKTNFQDKLVQLASDIERAYRLLDETQAIQCYVVDVVLDLKQYQTFLAAAMETPSVRASEAKLALFS